jgi:hypothetical protein
MCQPLFVYLGIDALCLFALLPLCVLNYQVVNIWK